MTTFFNVAADLKKQYIGGYIGRIRNIKNNVSLGAYSGI